MWIKWIDFKPGTKNSHTKILFKCDKCGEEFEREKRRHIKMKKNPLYNQHYCRKCWNGITVRTDEYRLNMSKIIRKLHKEHPEIGKRISKILKERKVNVGEKNGSL